MRDAIALMTEAAEELDAYYAQEHAGDHPHSVRKLAQAKEENPARAALTALQEQPAPVGVGDDDGSLRWAALRLAQEAEIDGMADRAGWDCWVALVKSRSAFQPSPAREEAEAKFICINAHDRCYGGAGKPCDYCERALSTREEAEALVIPDAASIAFHLWEEAVVEEMLFARKIADTVHAFIARHHLGEKP
jgi:hypothetical protein